jgi:hypothetical protein
MRRSAAAGLGIVWALAACLAIPAWAQDDAFALQHAAALEKSAARGALSIAFAGDQRAFQPGETISLLFQFHRYDISPHNY